MRTKIMRRYFIPLLLLALLALLWPSAVRLLTLGFVTGVGCIWAAQASRLGKHLWGAGPEMIPRKVKYEN